MLYAEFLPQLSPGLFVSWEMKRDSSTPGGPPSQAAIAFGNEFYSSVDRGLEFDAWFEASASGDWHWDWKRIVYDYDNQRVGTAILNDTVLQYNITRIRGTSKSDFSSLNSRSYVYAGAHDESQRRSVR